MSSALNVWMNGELVGTWKVDRGSHSFTYAEPWTRSERSRSISLSIPITAARSVQGPKVESFFDNLLPDNDKIRERLSRRFSTRNSDAFSLLQAIGRDCVGAVQLLPEDTAPEGWDRIEYDILNEHDVSEILRQVPADVAGQGENDQSFRISLAGAQEKTALLNVDGKWCRPRGATPTTHILKLPLGFLAGSRRVDLSDSVQNEWLCGRILAQLGLPVAHSEVTKFEDQQALMVTRFDRQRMADGPWIARIPQEDFCQALGFPPSRKYESEGGPGMKECLGLLDGSADAAGDRVLFQLTQLCFWLLAAGDGHAKNYSIFLRPNDEYVMTPLYDVVSFWPYFGTGSAKLHWRKEGLAMALRARNAHRTFESIQTRHWHHLTMRNGGPEVWQAMIEFVESVEPALQAVADTLADRLAPTWEPIESGVLSQVQRFRDGLAGLGS